MVCTALDSDEMPSHQEAQFQCCSLGGIRHVSIKQSSHFVHRKVIKVCAFSRLYLHKFLAGLWWKPFALPGLRQRLTGHQEPPAQHSEAQILRND